MLRVSRIRSRGVLAVGHHPQEDEETTHKLACAHSQLSYTRTQGWERGYLERLGPIFVAMDGSGDSTGIEAELAGPKLASTWDLTLFIEMGFHLFPYRGVGFGGAP